MMADDKDRGLRIRNAAVSNSSEDLSQQQVMGASLTPSSFSSGTPLLESPLKSESRSLNTPFLKSWKRETEALPRALGWYSIVPLVVSGIFSTLASGTYLAVATLKPQWTFVDTVGTLLTPSSASTVTTAVAKTIELSFVTFFLAMLGQYLTRRASSNDVSGVSLTDLQLKVLMVLPGTLFTQWKYYGRALRSLLGLAALIACFSAMLYTVASDALVSPKPSMNSNTASLQGKLQTSPANLDYIQSSCPAAGTSDQVNCFIIEHAGTAYHNLIQFMTNWQQLPTSNTSVDDTQRPPPVAAFRDNVTVQGSWVDQSDMLNASQTFKRTITNVSMAMPHTGVVDAATLQVNHLPQLRDFNADSIVKIYAQTVVPVVNVLCANASAQDLLPLIYKNWSHPANGATPTNMSIPPSWRNSTVFDPIFGFGENSPPPVFYRLPGANNSLLNGNWHAASSQYLILAYGQSHQINYNLCSMSMSLRGGCSTELGMTMSSSRLTANCAQQGLSYNPSLKAQQDTAANWAQIAYHWAEAVALDTGAEDNNAALPAMLAQLAPQAPGFSSTGPSIVESLAVLAACTLLDSMVDAPFNGSWEFSSSSLANAIMQPFTARVSMSVYASGPGSSDGWQYVFMAVLGAVFILSLVCFSYLLYISALLPCLARCGRGSRVGATRSGLRKDCTDMGELVQIALNSPAPRLGGSPAQGSAGKGGSMRSMRWHLREAAAGDPGAGELAGLCLSFDGDQSPPRQRMVRESFLSPPSKGYAHVVSKSVAPLDFEDVSYD